MSVIIAMKYDKGVVIGSDRQVSKNQIKDGETTKINESEYSNTAFGGVGYLRDLDILSYHIKEIMDTEDIMNGVILDKGYVVTKIVPELFDLFHSGHRITTDAGIDYFMSTFIICSNKNIFTIGTDGGVMEYENYATIGCGEQLVKGYLDGIDINSNNLSRLDAMDLIINAIKNSCKDSLYINDNIDFIVLEDNYDDQ